MTEENLKWLENVFRRTVGENGEIRLQDFKNIVHSKNVSIWYSNNEMWIANMYFVVKTFIAESEEIGFC